MSDVSVEKLRATHERAVKVRAMLAEQGLTVSVGYVEEDDTAHLKVSLPPDVTVAILEMLAAFRAAQGVPVVGGGSEVN